MYFLETPRQISRLYRPLSGSNSSLNLGSDSDDDIGTQLLPLHNKPDTPRSTIFPQNKTKKGKGRARSGSLALGNVWDEREELFGVGEDDDNESTSEDGGEDPPPPASVPLESNEPPQPTKSVKSVRWAEGSS